jgi:aryl-alcohol dehydrogenase-like predicted oxidoreductase
VKNRIALGTAQFGQAYGIANRGDRVSRAEARKIIVRAHHEGLDTLDTAPAYSDSEVWLGDIGVDDWRVITKISALPVSCNDVSGWVTGSIEKSLARLRLQSVDGVLLHHPSDLLGRYGSELYAVLSMLRRQAKVRRIGISAYDPYDVGVLTARFKLDLVQAPYNVLDRRMKSAGMLEKLRDLGVEFHARSAFLQGLLLMNATTRPPYFSKWNAVWERWREWLSDNGITAIQACLHAVLSNSDIARVVVGVDSESQLDEMLEAASADAALPPDSLASDDTDLLNPSKWPKR